VKTRGHGSGYPPDYDKPLDLAFSFNAINLWQPCARISAIEILKTSGARLAPALIEDKPLKHELFRHKTNVMSHVARLLVFSGLIATNPMIPPLLENWTIARLDTKAQLA
jgi:hypothetical protein